VALYPLGLNALNRDLLWGRANPGKMIAVDDDNCVLHATLKQTRWALQKQEPISWTVMRNQAIHDSCICNSVDYNLPFHFICIFLRGTFSWLSAFSSLGIRTYSFPLPKNLFDMIYLRLL